MSALENIKKSINEGHLTEDQVMHLLEAYNEDSASATNWLISVLKLVRGGLENRLPITVLRNSNFLILETPEDLVNWIEELFPEIARDC